jgi:hypothetical protein
MPGKVTFRVDGAREIEAARRELGAQAANRAARRTVNRSAMLMARREELVPANTGQLRRWITKPLRRQRRRGVRDTRVCAVGRIIPGPSSATEVQSPGRIWTLFPARGCART